MFDSKPNILLVDDEDALRGVVAERLQDEGYRDRIARALAAGLAAYKRRFDQKSGVATR